MVVKSSSKMNDSLATRFTGTLLPLINLNPIKIVLIACTLINSPVAVGASTGIVNGVFIDKSVYPFLRVNSLFKRVNLVKISLAYAKFDTITSRLLTFNHLECY